MRVIELEQGSMLMVVFWEDGSGCRMEDEYRYRQETEVAWSRAGCGTESSSVKGEGGNQQFGVVTKQEAMLFTES